MISKALMHTAFVLALLVCAVLFMLVYVTTLEDEDVMAFASWSGKHIREFFETREQRLARVLTE